MNVSETSLGNASFSKLPVSIGIILPFKSPRAKPSAVPFTTDWLTADNTVFACTTSWNSVVGFLKNLIGCVFKVVDKSTLIVFWYLTLYAFWNSIGTSTTSGFISPNIVNVARPPKLTGGEYTSIVTYL